MIDDQDAAASWVVIKKIYIIQIFYPYPQPGFFPYFSADCVPGRFIGLGIARRDIPAILKWGLGAPDKQQFALLLNDGPGPDF